MNFICGFNSYDTFTQASNVLMSITSYISDSATIVLPLSRSTVREEKNHYYTTQMGLTI